MSGCCPVCKRSVEDGGPHSPFCGDRCRLVDLGRWLDGSYRVPDPDAPVISSEPDGDEGSGGGAVDSDDSTVH